MLSIYYGDLPEAIYNPPLFFKNSYMDEWITDELSRAMIQDVDRSTVLGLRRENRGLSRLGELRS